MCRPIAVHDAMITVHDATTYVCRPYQQFAIGLAGNVFTSHYIAV